MNTASSASLSAPERVQYHSGSSVPIDSIGLLVAALDWCWIYLLGLAIDYLYHFVIKAEPQYSLSLLGPSLAIATLYTVFAKGADLYRASNLMRSRWQAGRTLIVWTLSFVMLPALALTFKVNTLFSRGELLLFYANGLWITVVVRMMVADASSRIIATHALALRRVVVIGTSEEIFRNDVLSALEDYGHTIVRAFPIDLGNADNSSLAIKATMSDIVAYVRRVAPDELLLTIPWDQPELIAAVESELRILPLPVKLLPDTRIARFLSRPLFDLGPAAAIELQRAPINAVQRVTKQLTDRALALVGVALVVPLMVIVAIAIRLESPGPILFRQKRMGFNGEPFLIYKFRTMSTLDDGPTVLQAERNDKRVTTLGRLIRRLSIDELPQLLNVIRGEMSLIGPRPHALAHDDKYSRMIDTYAIRHKMKPGITGWAQVNGFRGETRDLHMMEERVAHDLWYIEYWSFWLDIRILFLTVFRVLRSPNAY
jgi:Undecaprenyl-phosphate glucose phosphotransferase